MNTERARIRERRIFCVAELAAQAVVLLDRPVLAVSMRSEGPEVSARFELECGPGWTMAASGEDRTPALLALRPPASQAVFGRLVVRRLTGESPFVVEVELGERPGG